MLYFDRKGERISGDEWRKKNGDESYRVLRLYDNGVVRVLLAWSGKLTLQQKNSYRDTWPLFEMGVWNYDSNGILRVDPVSSGVTYPDEESAIAAYEDFLLKWTECEVNDEGEFVEVDNDLAPPPPPDPNKPESKIKELPDDFVAW